jgi:RND superfamily putative drug exporter
MRDSFFYVLGTWIYRLRWLVLLLTGGVLFSTLTVLPQVMTSFHATGFVDDTSLSAHAEEYLDKKLDYDHNNQLLILYHSQQLTTDNPQFFAKIKRSLAGVKNFSVQHEILLPDANPQQVSKDKHTAFAVVILYQDTPISADVLEQLQARIKHPKYMTMQMGGGAVFSQWVNKQTQHDLYKADQIAAPIAVLVLIGVFGSVVAALIPMCLGGLCALIILSMLYFLGQVVSLSIFTLNIALLLGLCLCLDYSLLMVSRFRNELEEQPNDIQGAIATTMATAGRAIFFSGLAVFVSLSALLIFPINILFSIGIGGLTAALMAVLVSLLLLPALLALLKHKINWLPLMRFNTAKTNGLWSRLATTVVTRPIRFFFVSSLVLIVLAYPFSHVKFGIADFHIFPEHSESRQFFDLYSKAFNANELTPIVLVVSKKKDDILSPATLEQLVELSQRLQAHPQIKSVSSIVTLAPNIPLSQYQAMYQHPEQLTPGVQQLLRTTTRKHVTVMRIVTKAASGTPEMKALIRHLRHQTAPAGMRLQWTGEPVINFDVQYTIERLFPYAVLLIMSLTYLILLFVMRSLFLPLKAIFMNTLSLCACYGVLVYVFQQGHLHQFLNFEPQGLLDMSLMIIVFCAIFGFSMDYEVFLLTRIQEAYRKTGNNKRSIVLGIEKSARIITSAAVIVICICSSFMVADILIIKEFGLGIAVAIFVDAFIIRSILVPSTMTLLDSWNWYLPKWLGRLLP